MEEIWEENTDLPPLGEPPQPLILAAEQTGLAIPDVELEVGTPITPEVDSDTE